MNELYKPGDYLELKESDFTLDYFDKEGDLPFGIIILSIPIYGTLVLNGKIINTINYEIKFSEMIDFRYYRISSETYSEEIEFQVSDNNPNKKYSNMAKFTINVNAYVNEPPSIGLGETTIDYNELRILTQEDFTSNTTPPYSDPEGDQPYKLKILSLPFVGMLKFNNNPVTVNQEILFSDINLGLLTYMSDNSVLTSYSLVFNFAVSDTGSQEFSE